LACSGGELGIDPKSIDRGQVALKQAYILSLKIIILMLLFKMVLGIIFGAYRKVKTAGDKQGKKSSVVSDFVILHRHLTNFLRSFWSTGYIRPNTLLQFVHHPDVPKEGKVDAFELSELLIRMHDEGKLPKGFLCRGPEDARVHADWIVSAYGKKVDSYRTGKPCTDCPGCSNCQLTMGQKIMLSQVFIAFDQDNSGTIDIPELAQALAYLEHPAANDPRYVKTAMQDLDLDGTGDFSYEEFINFVASDLGVSAGSIDFTTPDQ